MEFIITENIFNIGEVYSFFWFFPDIGPSEIDVYRKYWLQALGDEVMKTVIKVQYYDVVERTMWHIYWVHLHPLVGSNLLWLDLVFGSLSEIYETECIQTWPNYSLIVLPLTVIYDYGLEWVNVVEFIILVMAYTLVNIFIWEYVFYKVLVRLRMWISTYQEFCFFVSKWHLGLKNFFVFFLRLFRLGNHKILNYISIDSMFMMKIQRNNWIYYFEILNVLILGFFGVFYVFVVFFLKKNGVRHLVQYIIRYIKYYLVIMLNIVKAVIIYCYNVIPFAAQFVWVFRDQKIHVQEEMNVRFSFIVAYIIFVFKTVFVREVYTLKKFGWKEKFFEIKRRIDDFKEWYPVFSVWIKIREYERVFDPPTKRRLVDLFASLLISLSSFIGLSFRNSGFKEREFFTTTKEHKVALKLQYPTWRYFELESILLDYFQFSLSFIVNPMSFRIFDIFFKVFFSYGYLFYFFFNQTYLVHFRDVFFLKILKLSYFSLYFVMSLVNKLTSFDGYVKWKQNTINRLVLYHLFWKPYIYGFLFIVFFIFLFDLNIFWITSLLWPFFVSIFDIKMFITLLILVVFWLYSVLSDLVFHLFELFFCNNSYFYYLSEIFSANHGKWFGFGTVKGVAGYLYNEFSYRAPVLFEFDQVSYLLYKHLSVSAYDWALDPLWGIDPKYIIWYLNHASRFYKGAPFLEYTAWSMFGIKQYFGIYGYFFVYNFFWNGCAYLGFFVLGCVKFILFFSKFLLFEAITPFLHLYKIIITFFISNWILPGNINIICYFESGVVFLKLIIFFLSMLKLTVLSLLETLYLIPLFDVLLNFLNIILLNKIFLNVSLLTYNLFFYFYEIGLNYGLTFAFPAGFFSYNPEIIILPNIHGAQEYQKFITFEEFVNKFFLTLASLNLMTFNYGSLTHYPVVKYGFLNLVWYFLFFFIFRFFLTWFVRDFWSFIYQPKNLSRVPFVAWDAYTKSVFFDLTIGDFRTMFNSGYVYSKSRYDVNKKVDSFFEFPLAPSKGFKSLLQILTPYQHLFSDNFIRILFENKHIHTTHKKWRLFGGDVYKKVYSIFGLSLKQFNWFIYLNKYFLYPQRKNDRTYKAYFAPLKELSKKEQKFYFKEYGYDMQLLLTHMNPIVLQEFLPQILNMYPLIWDVYKKAVIKTRDPLVFLGFIDKDVLKFTQSFGYPDLQRGLLSDVAFSLENIRYVITPHEPLLFNRYWTSSFRSFSNWLFYLDTELFNKTIVFKDSISFFGPEPYLVSEEKIAELKDELSAYRTTISGLLEAEAEHVDYAAIDELGVKNNFVWRLERYVDNSFIKSRDGSTWLVMSPKYSDVHFSVTYFFTYGLILIFLYFFCLTLFEDRFPIWDYRTVYDWNNLNFGIKHWIYLYYIISAYLGQQNIEWFYVLNQSSFVNSIVDYDLVGLPMLPVKTTFINTLWKVPKNIYIPLLFSGWDCDSAFIFGDDSIFISFMLNFMISGPGVTMLTLFWSLKEGFLLFLLLLKVGMIFSFICILIVMFWQSSVKMKRFVVK